MSKLGLERMEERESWQKLLSRSPHATRFLDPAFLDLFGAEVRFYGLYRSGVCLMGLPVIDPRGLGAPYLPWCYQQGPVFYDEIYRSAQAKRIQYEIELAETGVTALAEAETWFRFALHHRLTDMRGYDWVHYHAPGKARCTLLPRYTAILPLAGVSQDGIRQAARSARRQEEGYARTRETLEISQTGTIEELFDLYCATFARQEVEVSALERALFAPYVTYFLERDIGRILTVRDSRGRAVAAAFLFEDYDKVWHVPLIGTGETRFGGTLLYFLIADHVRAKGGVAVDFDGANSPNRAYFKHSMGAHAQLYFELRYEA